MMMIMIVTRFCLLFLDGRQCINQELVNQFKNKEVPGFKRLPLVYALSLPPCWIIEVWVVLKSRFNCFFLFFDLLTVAKLRGILWTSSLFDRANLVHRVGFYGRVCNQQELGNLLISVGATGAALEVYLRLQMWENVIKCYSLLGHREKVWAI